jgi:hexosaminidase
VLAVRMSWRGLLGVWMVGWMSCVCRTTPAVQDWMAAQNPPMTSTDQVYEYFVSKVDAMTLALGKQPVRWEEVWAHFGTQLDPSTIIHAWLTTEAVINATSHGYRAIWSVDGKYYLDDLTETWQSFYDVDILAGITNTSAIPLVLGGETGMWGETADGSDVLQTIWPRAAAAAERQCASAAVGVVVLSPSRVA